jgi:hypothetical protein
MKTFSNPFRPGAGHKPPYLAGREAETKDFKRLLKQEAILSNVVLTGLRGVGKTVLLENWKPLAFAERWLWVGTDLSESTSVSEESLVTRLLADLAVVTSSLVTERPVATLGFAPRTESLQERLDYARLHEIYRATPGLVADKLKAILELSWNALKPHGIHGVIFAYDEAQTMSDHAEKEQFPLSLLLDVFQSIQKKGLPFMLVLVGLPTLFPKLVETRTFAERMFEVITLMRLDDPDSRAAITKPIEDARCPIKFAAEGVELIIKTSGGYPYFIQFVCKEIYDIFLQRIDVGLQPGGIPIDAITRKLDKDFFAGRWARATDRQRQLLSVIATLENSDEEFSVQEIVKQAKTMTNPFGSSHVNQMLAALGQAGLIYKNRHGKYSFAVPLLGHFILRQDREANL